MRSAGRAWPVLSVFCAAWFCADTAVCQQPQTTAEMKQSDTPVTFSTAVNLVLVPVVVRDAKGKVVGDLTKDDFQLFDKGKPQTIVRFSIDKVEAPPIVPDTSIETDADGNPRQKPPGTPVSQAVAQRFVAWLYDDIHLSFADLAQTRVAAIKMLSESFEPGTRAAIFTTSGRTVLDFTDDREKLKETLNLIRPSPTAAEGPAQCPDISYYQADQLINQSDTQALQAGEAEYVACNPPPNGTSTAQAMTQAEPIVRAMAMSELSVGNNDTKINLSVLTQVVRRMAVMPGSRSIVMVSPGFHLTTDHRTDETDVIDRAIRANVTINSLDARGVYAIVPGGTADTAGGVSSFASNIKLQYQIASATSDGDVLAEFASATGGSFIQNSNDYLGGFKRIAAQPEFIYVLGFAPQNLKLDGSYRTLKVTLKNGAGMQIQARRGYFVRKHSDDAAEQAKEEVKEAFFSRDEVRDIPVELHTQFFKTDEYNAKVSIVARVNIKHLHYRKADGRNYDTLTMVGGVFDRNGNYVAGAQKTVDMKLKDQTLEAIPEEGITVRTALDVKSGSYIVRLVVRDSEGQVMSAQNSALEIP